MKMERLARVNAAASALGIGRTKLFELIRSKELDSIQIGRRRLITIESIDALIARSADASDKGGAR